MINAAEARELTLERTAITAKEFVEKNVAPAIESAARAGRFFDTITFEDSEFMASEVIKVLEAEGFEAEHVYYDGPNGYSNYILVKWGDA